MKSKEDTITIQSLRCSAICYKSHNSDIKEQITGDTKYVFVGTNTQYHKRHKEGDEDYSFASSYFYGGVDTSVYKLIDEAFEADKDNSLVLKKELLCKKLKNDDIWGWEIVEQDMQEILKEHKIAFLDTIDHEIIHEGSDGSKVKGSVALDYDSFVETYNKNPNIIFMPTSLQARAYLDQIEENTGLKFHISSIVIHRNAYVPDGICYCANNDDYFEWLVDQYIELDN